MIEEVCGIIDMIFVFNRVVIKIKLIFNCFFFFSGSGYESG